MSAAIAKLHAEWAARCVPPGASPVQRQEMERAFYAGFIACLVFQLTEVATIEDDDEAALQLEALHQEGRDFFHRLDGLGPNPRDPSSPTMSTIPTPRTDDELARLLLDQELTNIDRREAMAEFARKLEVELVTLGQSIAGVCRTNSDNADAMIKLVQANGEQRDRIEAQALHNRDLQAVLAWLNSHPDAIQRSTDDHADGNNWALVLNTVLIGWFPSIEAAVTNGRELEALLPNVNPPPDA